MDTFDFESIPERRGTACSKWDDAPSLFGGDGVLPMWVADMDFPAPPVVLEALRARLHHGVLGYPGTRQDATIEALVGWQARRHGWRVDADDVVLAPGVVPSLQAALEAFTQPGDEVLVQPPVYHPFFDLARGGGRILSESPLVERSGRWTMDFHDLEAKAETAEILLLCHPHNPVGRAWSREELEMVCRICARTGTMVLSDEIHADLVHAPSCHVPLASLGILAPDRIATFLAPSKTFNLAGLNQAAVVVPDETRRREFVKVFRDRGVPRTNALGLVAMEAAYAKGDAWLDALLAHLQANARHLVSIASDRWPGVRVQPPEATYLAWLDCRELAMEEPALVRLFAQGARVGLNRGGMFGKQGRGWMRLNFGTSREVLDQALNRISIALEDRTRPSSPR